MVQTIIRETPELDRVQKEYEQFMTDENRKWEAESHDKWLHDQAQYSLEAMQDGRAEGLAIGKAEGKAEGITEGRSETLHETAKKMLAEGLDVNLIAKITGLFPEAISQLK